MSRATAERIEIRPQPGPQELFLSSPADVAIIGGSVYGGKTWALLYEVVRHKDVEGFTFAAFRRVMPEHTNPGGTWDESLKLYPLVEGYPLENAHKWVFPSGAWGRFASLQYENTVIEWKGAQICVLLFDQLETMLESQFFYMLARNRSTCGVRPYCRASCNPDPDSFVATLIAWWIDEESGYALPARSGVVRWFVRIQDVLQWSEVTWHPDEGFEAFAQQDAAARDELEARFVGHGRFAKSLTFILARLQDNKIGLELDPGYEANVRALPLVEQERLLGGDRGGNWKIRASAGKVFNRAWFTIVDAVPAKGRRVRFWDNAATAGGGDWTAGVRMLAAGPEAAFPYYIEHVEHGQYGSGERKRLQRSYAETDGEACAVRFEQEPASAGKDVIADAMLDFAGYNVGGVPASGDLAVRANPLAAQVQAGNVALVRGPWNEPFLRELHAFPTKGVPDDQVSAGAGAFKYLALGSRLRVA